MGKNIKMRVYNRNPLTRNPLQWDKHPGIKPYICFYSIEDNDKSNSGDSSLVRAKIDKASTDTKHNTRKLNLLDIVFFVHQGPMVVYMRYDMTVSIFEHLVITTRKGIDQMWVLIGKVLKVPSFTKFRNGVITWKEISREEAKDQWGLGRIE